MGEAPGIIPVSNQQLNTAQNPVRDPQYVHEDHRDGRA
jgi:hypothetical protein